MIKHYKFKISKKTNFHATEFFWLTQRSVMSIET